LADSLEYVLRILMKLSRLTPHLIIALGLLITSAMSIAVAAKTNAPLALRNTPIPQPSVSPTPTIVPSATIDLSQPTVIYPTIEPEPTTGFAGDKFTRFTIDKTLADSVGRAWVSFVNINDKASTVVPGTPAPANQLETVYLASPGGGAPYKVIDLPTTVDKQLYWSPNGQYLAYFIPNGSSAGLYVLDLKLGLSVRMFAIDNLNPRGIDSEPVWSTDSSRLTIALTTEYDVDIYSIGAEGNDFRNLTHNGAYDFWPVWSPDGQYMAFVSDRARCASWVPNEPGSCYRPDAPVPDGGNLYVMEAVSGEVRQLSDAWVTVPPHWVSSSRVAFISGKAGDPTAGSSLWWADLRGGPAHQVTPDNGSPTQVQRDSWTADGRRVVYQEVKNGTQIVIRDEAGNEIARSADLNFPRVAFAADWSPDGRQFVMGGRNGQCPYGMLIADDSLNLVTKNNANPGVCEPSWSRDGHYIAFTGVTQSGSGTDGRYDVFISGANGLAARNVSGRYGGRIRLLGWVGG
jgi:Tol biopolymer transport system component